MTRKIIVVLLAVCILGCLAGCSKNEKSAFGNSAPPVKEKNASKIDAKIAWLDVSRIYEQPQDKELVHIGLHGLITNVGHSQKGFFTIETAFCEVGSTKEIPGFGEISHIYVGDFYAWSGASAHPTETYSREFEFTQYEPMEVQKQAGKQFRVIVYLKQVVNVETNKKIVLQRLETTFTFTASPLQPYQIQ